jgi:hypothetical protein
MSSTESNANRLRNLIGTRARYQDALFEIIEVLEDGPALVLQSYEEHTTIQADQHGEAHRRVPQTMTLPISLTTSGQLDTISIGLMLLDNDHNHLHATQ